MVQFLKQLKSVSVLTKFRRFSCTSGSSLISAGRQACFSAFAVSLVYEMTLHRSGVTTLSASGATTAPWPRVLSSLPAVMHPSHTFPQLHAMRALLLLPKARMVMG